MRMTWSDAARRRKRSHSVLGRAHIRYINVATYPWTARLDAISREEALTSWGLPEERWNDAYAIVGDGPRIFIQKVPEPKTAKNRLHIDVHSNAGGPDQPKDWDVMRAKAAKLVDAGADVVEEFRQPPQGEWIVMEDPEGNEFCVV